MGPLQLSFPPWFKPLVTTLCRTHASGHSSQGIADDKVSNAGVSTTAPGRSAILCYWMDRG